MKHLFEYIDEALQPQTGIGAFDWQIGGTHVIIDNVIQQLKSNGFKAVSGRTVNTYEYKVTHDGACLCVGLKGKRNGDRKEHRHKVFIRQDADGKVDITTKHYDPDGTGTWYTAWILKNNKLTWANVSPNNLSRKGHIDDTAENATKIVEKILSRTNRFGV